MKDLLEKIINYVPGYLLTLATMFSEPKEFLAVRKFDASSEWVDALVFLAISTLVSALAEFLISPSSGEIWNRVAAKLIAVLAILGMSVVTGRFSLWLVGGRIDYKTLFIVYAYISAVMMIIMEAFNIVASGIFKALDPDLFSAAMANRSSPAHAPAFWIYLGVMFIGLCALFVWFFIAWGAFRQLAGISKFRSGLAFVIYNIISFPIAGVVGLFVLALS